MRKNSKIHLWIETDSKQTIEKQAKEKGLSINEFCRRKLRECSQLYKIEVKLEEIDKKLNTQLNLNRR